MLRHSFCFTSFVFVLGSCVRIPDHDLAKEICSCECESVVKEALILKEFEEGDWPSREWWKRFQDPVLDELIASALKLNPTLKVAEDRLKLAHEIAMQQRAKLYPEVYLEGDDNWQHYSKTGFFRTYAPNIPPVVNDVNLGLSFSYEFDFWGKNRALFHSALQRAHAAELEKMQSELILTTSIAYSYAELQLLLYKKEILEQRNANREAVSEIRAKRIKYALDNKIDWLDASSQTLVVTARLTEIDQELYRKVHQLKALSGIGQDASLKLVYRPIPVLKATLPKNLSLNLIARRPDLLAQKMLLEGAAFEIDAAKTDFYPNINLAALAGFETVSTVFPFSKIFQAGSFSGNLNPAIYLPIFTAGRLKAALYEKVAAFNEAVHAYNELILLSAQEVADSLTTLAYLHKEATVHKDLLEVAKEQLQYINRRFVHALNSRISLLDAQNAVLEEEIKLADIEYAKLLATVLLIRHLGGGYGDE